MEQIGSSSQTSRSFASSLLDNIKRIATGIGSFVDFKGYKKEIAQYESELQQRDG